MRIGKGALGTASVAAGILTVSSADLARRTGAVNTPAGAALAAYPAWCAFATVLSTSTWWLNRDRAASRRTGPWPSRSHPR
ncbi:TspO/MBR family protein [Gordonia westfalica]|uniref:TspO/MBR family protein n=1 Tax=Gordonia westfalica TaxID=158898 RepID=A0A1H2JEN0_9ACTN|nr:TspO/MBR family protein [Gordonia westfalica]